MKPRRTAGPGKVRLPEKFGLIKDYWSPRIAGELNDSYVKLVKLKGPFVWHHHEEGDELFLVVRGRMTMELRDKKIELRPGELFIVPKGMEHRPIAHGEVHVVLIELKTTVNTGNVRNRLTVDELGWV